MNAQVTFAENPEIKVNILKKENFAWSDKTWKGTVVKPAIVNFGSVTCNYAYCSLLKSFINFFGGFPRYPRN